MHAPNNPIIWYIYNAHPLATYSNTTCIQSTTYNTYYHYISPLIVCIHFQLGSEINLESEWPSLVLLRSVITLFESLFSITGNDSSSEVHGGSSIKSLLFCLTCPWGVLTVYHLGATCSSTRASVSELGSYTNCPLLREGIALAPCCLLKFSFCLSFNSLCLSLTTSSYGTCSFLDSLGVLPLVKVASAKSQSSHPSS